MKLSLICKIVTLMALYVQPLMGESTDELPSLISSSTGWSPGVTGRDTCIEQHKIVSFTVERLDGTQDLCKKCGQSYKVCLTLQFNRSVVNDTHILETCVKNSTQCHPDDFADYLNLTYNTSGIGLAQGESGNPPDNVTINNGTQCQIGSPGEYLAFFLDDGQCWIPPYKPGYVDGANKTVEGSGFTSFFQCHSRRYWNETMGVPFGTCSCRDSINGCVWRVQLPPCDDSPSPSPSPDCFCPEPNDECRNEDIYYETTLGHDHHLDITNCTDPEGIAEQVNEYGRRHGQSYRCTLSKLPNCNNIYCESFVPPEAYEEFSHCPLRQPWR